MSTLSNFNSKPKYSCFSNFEDQSNKQDSDSRESSESGDLSDSSQTRTSSTTRSYFLTYKNLEIEPEILLENLEKNIRSAKAEILIFVCSPSDPEEMFVYVQLRQNLKLPSKRFKVLGNLPLLNPPSKVNLVWFDKLWNLHYDHNNQFKMHYPELVQSISSKINIHHNFLVWKKTQVTTNKKEKRECFEPQEKKNKFSNEKSLEYLNGYIRKKNNEKIKILLENEKRNNLENDHLKNQINENNVGECNEIWNDEGKNDKDNQNAFNKTKESVIDGEKEKKIKYETDLEINYDKDEINDFIGIKKRKCITKKPFSQVDFQIVRKTTEKVIKDYKQFSGRIMEKEIKNENFILRAEIESIKKKMKYEEEMFQCESKELQNQIIGLQKVTSFIHSKKHLITDFELLFSAI